MNRFSLATCTLCMVALCSMAWADTHTHYFAYDGFMRDYDVHLPQDYTEGMPLVMVLPGYSETKSWFRQYSRIHDHADTSGYVLAIPTGSLDATGTLSWNIGLEECPLRGVMPATDDIGFISAVIDSIHAEYAIDLSKVYCTGFSTGGEMSLRIAAQIGHRLAAVASVAGSMYDCADQWEPIRPIPLLTINGTADNYVFYYDSDSTIFSHSPEEWSIPHMLDYWVEHNTCELLADTVNLPNLVEGDHCSVQQISFSGESSSSDIVHYKVINGGHHWPQGTMNWYNGGYINMDINGNATHWEFFQEYQNPLTDLAFTDTFFIHSRYVEPFGGILGMSARLRNPGNHEVTLEGMLLGFSTGDTISVFLEDDSTQSDGMYEGTIMLDEMEEGFFQASLRTMDVVEELTTEHHLSEVFTTAGPVSYLDHSYNDSLIHPGDVVMIELHVLNESESFAFSDVKVELVLPEGTPANFVGTSSRAYGDIDAGASASNTLDYWVRIDAACPGDTSLTINLNISSEGVVYWSDEFTIQVLGPVSLDSSRRLPVEYALHQNYPNPFNPVTTMSYDLPSSSDVKLTVYDITGRVITTLRNGHESAGTYEVEWSGTDDPGNPVSTGLYFCRLEAGKYTKTIKMLYLK